MVLLVGYVYSDAKRRGMRYVLWTWLAALIPNAIGIILYFVLREPLLVNCTHCGAQARPGFTFCPKCGGSLSPACPQCRRAVEPGWTHCVQCGASLKAA
jgi:predicted amidophosphoribosyltransferase